MTARLLASSERLAGLYPPLLIEAERVAATVIQGVHGRRRKGMGDSFWQFRDYESADGANRIDWRQSARTDRYFVREREWEAVQTVYLWADNSPSMHYASTNLLPAKADRARLLMLALASLVLRSGEKVEWQNNNSPIKAYGHTNLPLLAAQLAIDPTPDCQPATNISRHSFVVLASDFLFDEDKMVARLAHYADRSVRGVLLHVVDPAEENFPFSGRVDLEGLESEGVEAVFNAANLKTAYQQRMAEHKARLGDWANKAGWQYLAHNTASSPATALMAVFGAMAK